MGDDWLYDRIYRPAREAELDGTQAIADAIAPAPEPPIIFAGGTIVSDPRVPNGSIWLASNNTFYVYTGTTWEKMDGTK